MRKKLSCPPGLVVAEVLKHVSILFIENEELTLPCVVGAENQAPDSRAHQLIKADGFPGVQSNLISFELRCTLFALPVKWSCSP